MKHNPFLHDDDLKLASISDYSEWMQVSQEACDLRIKTLKATCKQRRITMIEKLKWDEQPEDAAKEVQNLIDQLVDAVNEIMTWRFETDEDSDWYDDPKHREQPAENVQTDIESRSENVPDLDIQMSWIGHLCRFWDYSKFESTYAILEDINVWCEHPYCKSSGNQYKHCEPVKPDDDIIYKGGNNE